MSILLERGMIMVGLRTEGMEDDPKKQSQRRQGQGQEGQGMPMNMSQPNVNMPMSQMPMPMNTSPSQESRDVRETNGMNHPNMNMHYGIQEPSAANEMGSFMPY
jgi:hypothetical protein